MIFPDVEQPPSATQDLTLMQIFNFLKKKKLEKSNLPVVTDTLEAMALLPKKGK